MDTTTLDVLPSLQIKACFLLETPLLQLVYVELEQWPNNMALKNYMLLGTS